MLVVYVAGPFRAPTAWGIAENVRRAERAGLEIARLGAMPLIPHANTAHFQGELPDQFFLDGTLELMLRSDALYLLFGWASSAGARKEREVAMKKGMPVFDTLASLNEWVKSR